MPINVQHPFSRRGPFPIDESLVLTKAEMKTANDNEMPDIYFTICSEDKSIYMYDKSATPDATTGKYTKYAGGSGVEAIELTQAQYDALPDDQKNNGTIYFITDGQGGGTAYQAGEGIDIANGVISVKDEFVKWNVARADASKSTLTSYKKYSGDDAQGLFQISTRAGGTAENKVGDMDINVWVQAGTNKISKLDFFYCDADGEAMRVANSIIIEDTGWQNGNGIRYRKKNGLLFVAYGDYTPSENIPAGVTHTMDTLPQEYRPSTRVLGVIMSGNEKVNASVETDGRVNVGGFPNVVTAGTIVPLRGQLITIM